MFQAVFEEPRVLDTILVDHFALALLETVFPFPNLGVTVNESEHAVAVLLAVQDLAGLLRPVIVNDVALDPFFLPDRCLHVIFDVSVVIPICLDSVSQVAN